MDPSTENLDDLLEKMVLSDPNIKAAAIVSRDGLPIASSLPYGIDETRFAVITALLFSLSKTSVNEMEQGQFEEIYIKGREGYLLVKQAGPNSVLILSTTKKVRDLRVFRQDR